MAINNFKKILLAGTALVAVAAFSSQAQALPRVMAGANGTWASSGPNAATAAIADAVTGDAVDITTGAATLTITNNNTATDGGGLVTFSLGAITDTGAGVATVAVVAGASAGVQAVTISSAVIDGAFSVAYADNTISTGQTVAITNALTVGTTFSLVNSESAAAETQAMTVGGALTVTGASTLTGGTRGAGGTTTALTVTGNSTFTGAVTVTGGANDATNTATLTLNGATNAFTGGLTLADGAAGGSDAILNLKGAVAQTVSGTIAGGSVGKINIDNALGATFSGTVAGALITIEKAGGNSAATFQNTVASAITLGGAGTGTNTVTFDGTTQAFTVTGAILGAIAGETNNIAVVGGKTITLATASVTDLDGLSVTGTGTVLTTGFNLTTTTATVGTGATLTTTGGTLTTASTLTGTLAMAGGVGITGTVNGSAAATGTLAVTAVGLVTGNIGTTNSLSAITVATTGALTVTGDVLATTTTLTGTGSLGFVTGTTRAVTTNIVAAVTGDGAITQSDTNTAVTTITGNIGTSASRIATYTILDGVNTTTTTTTGNLFVNAISIGAADTLQFLGTTAQTVSGTLTGAGAGNKGILTVGNGTTASNVTFSGLVGGATLTLASAGTSLAATATYAAGLNIAGAFTSAGTTTLSGTATSALTGTVTNTGTLTDTSTGLVSTGAITNSGAGILTLGTTTALSNTAAMTSSAAITNTATIALSSGSVLTGATQVAGAGTWNFSASTTAATGLTPVAGRLVLGAGADFTGTTINVNVPSTTGFIATGRAFRVVDGVGAATGASATAVAVASDNSALLSFTFARGDNATVIADGNATDTSDIYVIATRAAYSTLSNTTTNDSSVGTALNTIAGTGTTELDAIQGQLNNAATGLAVHNILESVSPTVDGSVQAGSLAAGSQVQGLAETRIASLRSGDALSGVAAGASANGWNLWVQGYGQTGTQDTKSGVKGYDSDTFGGAVGVDSTGLLNNAVVGVSFNYGKTEADSDNANTTSTEVDSYGLNLYGSHDLGSNLFANGQIGFARNNIDTVRHNATGPGLGVSALGSTDSNQYSAKLGFGRDYAADHGLTLTPSISAAYTHLKTDGFTETGAGGANLVVGSSSLSVLNLGVGGTAAWKLKNSDGSTLKPSLSVGYAYNLLNDKVDLTSSFTGDTAGTAFVTNGASPDRSQFNAGAGVTYMTTANWDLSANYGYTYKENYDAHTGTLRATSRF